MDCANEVFSLAEICHRSRLRYDLRVGGDDTGRRGRRAEEEDDADADGDGDAAALRRLGKAVSDVVRPVLRAMGFRFRSATELPVLQGVVTAFPGASAQQWSVG